MDASTAIVLMLVGFLAGGLLVATAYEQEISRQAHAIERRDPTSNTPLRVSLPTRGWKRLAEAVSRQFEAVRSQRLADLRRQQDYQRELSALSHDIRTPLAGALGYVQLAERALGRDDVEGARKDLGLGTGRLDATRELLDMLALYVKTNDPDRTYDLEELPLLPKLLEVLTSHAPELEERGWEPTVEFADEALRVRADAVALTRILDNLVTNALRHGTGELTFRQTGMGQGATLVVSNRVKDPAAIDVRHLFDRFYRADRSRSTPGMGLGLAIAHQLAEDLEMPLSARLDDDVISFVLDLSQTALLPLPRLPRFF